MAGAETTDPAGAVLDLTDPPPIDEYRYATAILDHQGRYVLVNQSFAGLHGGSAEDLHGRAEQDLVARAEATALAANDRLALEAASATVVVERVLDSVGRRRVVMCRCAVLDAGVPVAVCRMYGSATARDRVIAEFRRLLETLDPTGARAR
ncbi:MAG: PAS domain-containing protein, partial [Actinobacteria bacterium]|nr:PAS domain-containing protein [Actinomycetota bacterium]